MSASDDARRIRSSCSASAPDSAAKSARSPRAWTIDAATAERYGLVNRVVPHDQLLPLANEWARRLAQGPALALGMTKRMINNEWNMDLLSAIEAEAQAQNVNFASSDTAEAMLAFVEKRAPKFEGR